LSGGDHSLVFQGPVYNSFHQNWIAKNLVIIPAGINPIDLDHPAISSMSSPNIDNILLLDKFHKRRLTKEALKPWAGSKFKYDGWQGEVVDWLDNWVPGKPQLWLYGDSGCYKSGFIDHLFSNPT
jgi:hypothetical protein